MGGGEEESVEASAAARRERLRALKAAQELLDTPDDNPQNGDNQKPQEQLEQEKDEDDNEEEEEANVSMKFRNYLPHDKQLQEGKVAPRVLPEFEDPVLAAPPEEKKEDPFLNIAPKKPNWDLRRDVQKKLDKLERRTQKAMLVLMVSTQPVQPQPSIPSTTLLLEPVMQPVQPQPSLPPTAPLLEPVMQPVQQQPSLPPTTPLLEPVMQHVQPQLPLPASAMLDVAQSDGRCSKSYTRPTGSKWQCKDPPAPNHKYCQRHLEYEREKYARKKAKAPMTRSTRVEPEAEPLNKKVKTTPPFQVKASEGHERPLTKLNIDSSIGIQDLYTQLAAAGGFTEGTFRLAYHDFDGDWFWLNTPENSEEREEANRRSEEDAENGED